MHHSAHGENISTAGTVGYVQTQVESSPTLAVDGIISVSEIAAEASGMRQLAGTKTRYRRAHAAPLAGPISGRANYRTRDFKKKHTKIAGQPRNCLQPQLQAIDLPRRKCQHSGFHSQRRYKVRRISMPRGEAKTVTVLARQRSCGTQKRSTD